MSVTAPVSKPDQNQRYVGIRPRIKQTANGEARPTQVVIIGPGDLKLSLELESDQDELDFVKGIYPTGFRRAVPGEDLSVFQDHHVERDEAGLPIKVPAAFEGLRAGDVVSMVMGGSGDYLAFALSRQGENVGALVTRITPFAIKSLRGDGKKDDDAELLTRLVHDKPELFTPVYVRDRAIVRVRECQRLRIDVMKARIACGQRLRQRFIGEVFCSEDGLFPEGSIEKEFEDRMANDVVLKALVAEENRAKRDLEKAIYATDVWTKVLEQVEGCGPGIAARLISTIQDVRRFESASKLKRYLGAHVQPDGKFPRRRAGELAGWSNEGRQALYLLMDQFNRSKTSVWGLKLRKNKAAYEARYPHPHLVFTHEGRERTVVLEPGTFEKRGAKYVVKVDGQTITVTGKQRYFKGHLQKMALWKTSTKFVEWLFREWWKLENEQKAVAPEPPVSVA